MEGQPQQGEMFIPKYSGAVYNKENPVSIEEDPRYREIIEEKSLEYLKKQGAGWFSDEHSGELAPSGYLLDKDGKETAFLPSQSVGDDFVIIENEALQEFMERHPEDVEKFGLEELKQKTSDRANERKK